jgi:hypothetical protein
MPVPRGARGAGALAAALIAAVLVCASAVEVRAEEPFEISGEIDGLYPGAEATLTARVVNPYPFPIRVVTTRATVLDARDGCPASLLEVRDARTSAEIPAHGSGTVPLHVTLDRAAPDACQGATWPLVFSGTALVDGSSARLPETSILGVARSLGLVVFGLAVAALALVLAGRARRGDHRRVP